MHGTCPLTTTHTSFYTRVVGLPAATSPPPHTATSHTFLLPPFPTLPPHYLPHPLYLSLPPTSVLSVCFAVGGLPCSTRTTFYRTTWNYRFRLPYTHLVLRALIGSLWCPTLRTLAWRYIHFLLRLLQLPPFPAALLRTTRHTLRYTAYRRTTAPFTVPSPLTPHYYILLRHTPARLARRLCCTAFSCARFARHYCTLAWHYYSATHHTAVRV